jgi:hypothetical protein
MHFAGLIRLLVQNEYNRASLPGHDQQDGDRAGASSSMTWTMEPSGIN